MTVENSVYAAFARRIIMAHGRRVAAGDIAGLHELAELAPLVRAQTEHAIAALLDDGYSWQDVARELGTSKQAAHAKYGKRVTELQAERRQQIAAAM